MKTKHSYPLNLSNLISRRRFTEAKGWQNYNRKLTNNQKMSFLKLFGHGCRDNTKNRLWRAARDNFQAVKNCGILSRVTFEGKNISYCAGQDYPSEIAFIRNWIVRNY